MRVTKRLFSVVIRTKRRWFGTEGRRFANHLAPRAVADCTRSDTSTRAREMSRPPKDGSSNVPEPPTETGSHEYRKTTTSEPVVRGRARATPQKRDAAKRHAGAQGGSGGVGEMRERHPEQRRGRLKNGNPRAITPRRRDVEPGIDAAGHVRAWRGRSATDGSMASRAPSTDDAAASGTARVPPSNQSLKMSDGSAILVRFQLVLRMPSRSGSALRPPNPHRPDGPKALAAPDSATLRGWSEPRLV
jgi:hypothetical protein